MNSVRGAITTQEKKRGRKYTAKQKKFLKLFAENKFKEPEAMAAKAGYKGGYWQIIDSLKDDIQEIATAILVGAAPQAAVTLVETMTGDKPIPGAQNKMKAATEVLDRAGVVKVDKSQVDVGVSGGLFLLPVKHELKEPIDGEYEYVYEEEEEL